MRQRVSLVITDLDDTLYDWVHIWYSSFKPMLDSIVRTTGIPASDLEREFRDVHMRHGTSEYAFAIQELPSLRKLHPNDDLAVVFQEAIAEARKGRREAMMLFPSVRDTLARMKRVGCMIVGYTDSMAFYANYRVRRLGLDGLLDYVYSPPDHDVPDGTARSEIRRYSPEHYRLRQTEDRFVQKGKVKPDPLVLLGIVADLCGTPRETIYVGDKLRQDIAMARSASVASVWAKYGARTDNEEYDLLRRVSHWSPEKIELEKQTTIEAVEPDFVLSDRFGELLQLFDFRPFRSATSCADELDSLAHVVDAWKTTVNVQMHFNDLELRIRNYAITLLLAILTLSGFAVQKDLQVDLLGASVPLAALLIGGGLLAWAAFYFMDCHWYHNLLYGAVKHGMWIESRLSNILPELGLTKSIAEASPTPWIWGRIHTKWKMRLFYGAIATFLVVLITLLVLAHGPEGKRKGEKNGQTPVVALQPGSQSLQIVGHE